MLKRLLFLFLLAANQLSAEMVLTKKEPVKKVLSY